MMNLSQKLSGFAKTFQSALLTRWRGFCDSVYSIVKGVNAFKKFYDAETLMEVVSLKNQKTDSYLFISAHYQIDFYSRYF